MTHRRKDTVGHATDQVQASADPTHVTPAAACRLAFGQPLAMHQFLEKQRFLQRREGPTAGLREDRQQRLGKIAVPGVHLRGIAPEPAQGQYTAVAVDQDQPVAVSDGDGDAGDQLAALFD